VVERGEVPPAVRVPEVAVGVAVSAFEAVAPPARLDEPPGGEVDGALDPLDEPGELPDGEPALPTELKTSDGLAPGDEGALAPPGAAPGEPPPPDGPPPAGAPPAADEPPPEEPPPPPPPPAIAPSDDALTEAPELVPQRADRSSSRGRSAFSEGSRSRETETSRRSAPEGRTRLEARHRAVRSE
jgi:hypothetical protein